MSLTCPDVGDIDMRLHRVYGKNDAIRMKFNEPLSIKGRERKDDATKEWSNFSGISIKPRPTMEKGRKCETLQNIPKCRCLGPFYVIKTCSGLV